MILKPDLSEVWLDPFSATPMMIVCATSSSLRPASSTRDPRSTAKRAEAYLQTTGIGDTVYVGPEAEFFMFDDVRFEDGYAGSGFQIDDIELPTNTGSELDGGNLGHRRAPRAATFPVAPVDSAVDIRGEMVSTMLEMGLPCDKHHHEVAAAQHELGPDLRHAGADRRPHADLQVRRAHGRQRLRQDRDLHAQADQGR
jgi:glutamine synthetase